MMHGILKEGAVYRIRQEFVVGRWLHAASLVGDAVPALGGRRTEPLQWCSLLHQEHDRAMQWRTEEVALSACGATVNNFVHA